MGSGVINSSPLPLVYHNRIVEHHIRADGGEWGDQKFPAAIGIS